MSTTLKRPEGSSGKERLPARLRRIATKHKALVGGLAIVVVGLGIFIFLWFRPDKLFTNTTVNEALPTSRPAPAATTASTPAPQTQILASGAFRDLEHDTNGTAKIVQLPDGSRIVRLEDFRTSSGPDVVVLLSSIPATEDDWRAYDDGVFVNLGPLRGNVGNQNYAIPANVDLANFRSVVIWCRRFTVGFGAAPIV